MKTQSEMVKLTKLKLDPKNPRLPESVARDQASMLNYIAETTSIEELMSAIAANDYFAGEPLIVVPNNDPEETFTVVEGNRRLCAVKLLNDPTLFAKRGERLVELTKTAKYRPKLLPTIKLSTRDEVLPYLGFRHITGVKQWEPLAKARYIEQLFGFTDSNLAPGVRYGNVARIIGSRREHIKRNLDALAVYKIIKDADFFEIDELNDESLKFSVLSTALADERIAAFVGVVKKDANDEYQPTYPIQNPETLHKPAIKELTQWLYEKDVKGKTRLGESRNLRLLSAVVGNIKALGALRGGSPLKIAYQLTADVAQDFYGLLLQSEGFLAEASSMVATIAYEEDGYEVAKRIQQHIKLIGGALKAKRIQENDDF
jgi:ParB-like chromosome segregation protein Spo0J